MATNNLLVLVLGGTGLTGKSIVDGLLRSGNFVRTQLCPVLRHSTVLTDRCPQRVAVLIRPASMTKPVVGTLKASGIEIRVGDLIDDFQQLKQYLQGVDILISAVDARVVGKQRDFFRAAKEVGVQRVIPGDWATPGAKGMRVLADVVRHSA